MNDRPVLQWARRATPLGSSPEAVLGSTLVEVVRRLLQDELQAQQHAASASPRSPWMTPPAAARASGVPVKSIRAWVRSGRLTSRVRNRSADPKQHKYLVNVDEVVAIAERAGSARGTDDAGDFEARARLRAEEILAVRAAKGR